MTKNNEPDNIILNETMYTLFHPIVTSTGIKDKNKKNDDIDLQNSVNLFEEEKRKKFNLARDDSDNVNDIGRSGICPEYLYPQKKPNIRKEILFSDEESIVMNFNNRKKTFRNFETKDQFTSYKEEGTDKDYFNKYGETIVDLTIIDKQSDKLNLNDGITDIFNKENNWNSATDIKKLDLTHINQYVNDNNLCNITKLAYDLVGNYNKKSVKPFKCEIQNEITTHRKSFNLLSNKDSLLWVGVAFKNNESKNTNEQIMDWLHCNQCIKSFTLNLKSACPLRATLTIIQSVNVFHFTNQCGTELHQKKEITLDPQYDKKFFVAFHPIDSAYHNEYIVVQIINRKFKIKLFGYADPAKVELINFRILAEDYGGKKRQVYIKGCSGKNQVIRVFNSGVRTAFVSFYSYQNNVWFQPHWFILIPRNTMDINVNFEGHDDISFFFIHTDEDLRRACRARYTDFPRNDLFGLFEKLQVFTILPDEKTYHAHKLPKYDWRPRLLNQISSSFREVSIMTTEHSKGLTEKLSRIDQDSNNSCDDVSESIESLCTIDKQSKSSVNAPSSVSIIDRLNSITVYVNSITNIFNSVSKTSSGIVVLCDLLTFPSTVVNRESHSGILIRNNNRFPVSWSISNIVLISFSTLNADSCHNSNIETSSIYSLTSTPMYNPGTSFTVAIDNGVLQGYGSVLVPVTFKPLNTGEIHCKCTIKVFEDSHDCFFEKDIDLIAGAIRWNFSTAEGSVTSNCDTANTPRFSISPCVVNFKNIPVGHRVKLPIVIKNPTNHVKDIFISDVSLPFEFRAKQISLECGKSLISVFFESKTKGSFEDFLIFCDDEGWCTSILLKAKCI